MRMSEKCRKNSNKHNNNNSDISMTSRRIDVGKIHLQQQSVRSSFLQKKPNISWAFVTHQLEQGSRRRGGGLS